MASSLFWSLFNVIHQYRFNVVIATEFPFYPIYVDLPIMNTIWIRSHMENSKKNGKFYAKHYNYEVMYCTVLCCTCTLYIHIQFIYLELCSQMMFKLLFVECLLFKWENVITRFLEPIRFHWKSQYAFIKNTFESSLSCFL